MGSNLFYDTQNETSAINVGSPAPDFILENEEGKQWRLSDQLGQVTALLFYPKNETLVCTKQLCAVRDNWSDYLATKAVVVGISPGTTDEHRQFSKKYKLPLTLLADAKAAITESYSRHWLMPLRWTRAIVIVDAKGFVRSRKIMFRGFRPADHEVIASIYAARTDALYERFDALVKNHRMKN